MAGPGDFGGPPGPSGWDGPGGPGPGGFGGPGGPPPGPGGEFFGMGRGPFGGPPPERPGCGPGCGCLSCLPLVALLGAVALAAGGLLLRRGRR